MGRVAAIGEAVRVQGFALAGVLVLPGDEPAAVRASWAALPVRRRVGHPHAARGRRPRGAAPVAPPHGGDAAVTEHPGAARRVRTDPLRRCARPCWRTPAPTRRRRWRRRTRAAAETWPTPSSRRTRCWPRPGPTGAADAAACSPASGPAPRATPAGVVLAAQRDAYDAMRGGPRATRCPGSATIRSTPRCSRPCGSARASTSAEAVVREHPRGGVVGEGAGRRVEYSLDDLADESSTGSAPSWTGCGRRDRRGGEGGATRGGSSG